MQNVLVVSGGNSSERSVSLRSGASVAKALTQAGHIVSQSDPADGLDALLAAAARADVVFPVLHGAGGEDGSLQKVLEEHNLRFVGSGSASSALCFDKMRFKTFLQNNAFLTPKGGLVHAEQFPDHPLAEASFVLKPLNGGSSIDTFIVRNPLDMPRKDIDEAFVRHDSLLLEELISGVEITVGVLHDRALPVIEIIPPANQEFDFANKYNGTTQELCPPPNVTEATQEEAKALALAIHHAAGCRGLSRTDMIIDENGKPWVLETNTLPGMTDQSLFPKAAAALGISMPDLTAQLIATA